MICTSVGLSAEIIVLMKLCKFFFFLPSSEMFESHHPNIEKARKFLKKYVIKSEKPLPPRNSGRFSFHPNGFYSTLRARAWNEVLQHTGTGPTAVMLLLHTTLLIMYLSFLFSVPFLTKFQNDSPDTPERRSLVFELVSLPQFYVNTAMSGVVLALLMICSHNFFHQRDNWRMYAFDLSSFSSYDWRITHAYSHHVRQSVLFHFYSFKFFTLFHPFRLSPILRMIMKCRQPRTY